jgi:hypothetical protein
MLATTTPEIRFSEPAEVALCVELAEEEALEPGVPGGAVVAGAVVAGTLVASAVETAVVVAVFVVPGAVVVSVPSANAVLKPQCCPIRLAPVVGFMNGVSLFCTSSTPL